MGLTDEALLVVEGGPSAGESITLRGPTNTMGRQSTNDVVVPEAGVSRRHAEIVEDNGTFVNGEGIGKKDYTLKDGDSIRLAASSVHYIFQSPTANTLQLTLVHSAVEGPAESGESAAPETLLTDAIESESSAQQPEVEELYEGTIRLNLRAGGNMGPVVSFTQQLGDTPEFRVLRMANNREGGVDLWLAL